MFLCLLIWQDGIFLALKVAKATDAHADVDDLKSGRQQLAGGWCKGGWEVQWTHTSQIYNRRRLESHHKYTSTLRECAPVLRFWFWFLFKLVANTACIEALTLNVYPWLRTLGTN